MRYLIKNLNLILIILLFCVKSNAQDPHFSQFYANPMYLNPAYTGAQVCPRVIMNYRNQWPNLPGDFVTYNTSLDFALNQYGGVGLIALHDEAGNGVLTTTKISLLYSYHANLSGATTLSAGFQASYFQRSLNSNQYFGDMIDDLYGFIYPSFDPFSNEDFFNASYIDFSGGLLLTSDNYYAGLAVHHLTEPNYAFLSSSNEGRLPMKITFHGGTTVFLEDLGLLANTFLSGFTHFNPHLIFQKQADSEQINIGGSFISENWAYGMSYRRGFNNSDAIILILGYELNRYKIGYSYDLTVSKLGINSGGAHELSLQIQLDCFYKKPTQNAIPCPKF